jgi:2-phosphoglycerate kinase
MPETGTRESARACHVLLLGGAAGTGKTTAAHRLARRLGLGVVEIDDIHTTLERMTTPEQQPLLHHWRLHMHEAGWTAERIMALHISVAESIAPALAGVVQNHLDGGTPIVMEGDYLVPSVAARLTGDTDGRVRAVFLYEPDEEQIVRNFLARDPEEGEQRGRAHVSWLYGEWLKDQAAAHGFPALPMRPWEALVERITTHLSDA